MENTETEKKAKITTELAEKDFNSWCDANEIDCDTSRMNEEEKADFGKLKDRIVKAIENGRCVVDDTDLIYTLSDRNEGGLSGMKVTIVPPTGRTFLGMDGYKDNQSIHKTNAALSSITGQDTGVFAKLVVQDWKFFQSVLVLFLAN